MANTIPLVRSSALAPFLAWMSEAGRPVERRLREAGLPLSAFDDPLQPIPVVAAARFVRDLARQEGPDIGCRVVNEQSLARFGSLGRYVLGAGAPRAAFVRGTRAFGNYSSHEHLGVVSVPGGLEIRHAFTIPFDDETLSAINPFTVALIRCVLGGTGHAGPRLRRVELVPHPQYGLTHVMGWLDGRAVASRDRVLRVTIDDALLDRPYLKPSERAPVGPEPDWRAIRGPGTLAESIRVILPGLLELGQPTLRTMADLATLSPRTLQRRLAEEGTSLRGLVDELRRERAMSRLTESGAQIGAIATELGYSEQTSFSRAVRRWVRAAPREVRAR
jgi:AraC-like DNA-binding protein